MMQLNNVVGEIIEVTDNTITVDIDSSNFYPFAYPTPLPNAYSLPVVIPNSSGGALPPLALPYGNQDGLIGSIYNNGTPLNPINGVL